MASSTDFKLLFEKYQEDGIKRCSYGRIMEIIRMNYHRDPYKGDVFFFMSKNERSVRMLLYEKHSFNVHTRPLLRVIVSVQFPRLVISD